MKLKELYEIIKKNSIPEDAILLSDSGWECSATDMDGIYYNKKENIIVFTQEFDEFDKEYYNNPEWIMLKIN